MTAVFQRVAEADVSVGGKTIGACGQGCLILLGIAGSDCETDADKLAIKLARLRVFSDENGRLNKSIIDVGGSALVVPNFTLIADYSRGNRPDWFGAAPRDSANKLFMYFCSSLEKAGVSVSRGEFGADMLVSLKNDGPVTLVIDSRLLK